MRVVRFHRVIPLLVLIGLSACDRTPTDPYSATSLEESLRSGARSSVFAPASTSLSQVFTSAVRQIEQKQGPAAAQRQLANWRRLNDEALAALQADDRETARLKVEALRNEEIRIAVRQLGRRGVRDAVHEVGVELARSRIQLEQASGSDQDLTRAQGLATQVGELVFNANAALRRRDFPTALDQATRAGDLLDGVTHYLITLERIPALETQAADAVALLSRDRGSMASQRMLARLDAANQQARAALRSGDRERARQRLEAVRQEQIRIVLDVYGTRAVARLLDQVDAGLQAARPRIEALDQERPAERAGRMLAEASGLNARARRAFASGDAAHALDLASHAAGLINAVQHLLPH